MSLSPDTQQNATASDSLSLSIDCGKLSTSQGCAAKYNRDDLGDGGKQPVDPERLLKCIAGHATVIFGRSVTVTDLRSKRRFKPLVLSRQLFSFIMRNQPSPPSLQAIGDHVCRDHTTLMHSIEKAELYLDSPHSTDNYTQKFNALFHAVQLGDW